MTRSIAPGTRGAVPDGTVEAILGGVVIAIIRGIPQRDLVATVAALAAGGISCVEVTFDHSDQHGSRDTLTGIAAIRERFGDELAVGAGTVLSVDNVRDAASAGASYMISPNVDPEVVAHTKELGLVSIPGAMTASEAVLADRAGADIIKLFPAAQLGSGYIRALTAPLNHLRFTAVGGVNASNLDEFLAAGCVGVGVGGELVSRSLVAAGRFDELTRMAARYRRGRNN